MILVTVEMLTPGPESYVGHQVEYWLQDRATVSVTVERLDNGWFRLRREVDHDVIH